MPAGRQYHRDISGRIQFASGYEPSVEELIEAAKDGFPHVPHSRVIVIIIGKREPKVARFRLRSPDKNWAGYGPNDRPNTQAMLEKAQNIFPNHHPSKVRVGILKSGRVDNPLYVGLTIPSIGNP